VTSGIPLDIANPGLDSPAMNHLICADAFDDLQIGAVFRGKISPGRSRRLDGVDGVDNDGMSQSQMLVPSLIATS
jgi:hypothetical protein